MRKVAYPTVFPKPGVYSTNKIHVNLMSFTKGSNIYYTINGEEPNEESALFDLNNGLLTLESKGAYDEFIIKAFARKEGYEDSEIATYKFAIEQWSHHEFYYTILQENTDNSPAVIRIEDQYQVNMYFVIGRERALLIDGGVNRDGNLKGLLDMLADGLSYDMVVTHAHPDHDGQAQKLIDEGINCYFNSEDLPTLKMFDGSLEGYIDYKEGHVFDLGGCELKTYKIPGHTIGHMVLFDEANGLLFASDAFGNNRNTLLDTAFLQLGGEESTMDQYLSVLQQFRFETQGKVSKIFTGHNDTILNESFLDNLEKAVQRAVDEGEAGLTPTLRPSTECFGSEKISLIGNYIADDNWVGVNINHVYSGNYNKDNLSTLSAIFVNGAKLEPQFHPNIKHYKLLINEGQEKINLLLAATSSYVHKMMMNEQVIQSKEWCEANTKNDIVINITAPDGESESRYILEPTTEI